MGQETRCFDGFGPKLQIESGNPVMGTPGRSAFSFMSTTDSNVKFVQAHTESGLTKFDTQGTMQFEAGAHPKMVSSNATAFAFIAHKGDFAINADKGAVRVEAKQIILDASREIVIQSPKIRIGYEEENKTKDVKIIGQDVDIKSKKGSLADALLSSTMIKAFTGTLVSDLAIAASASPVSSAVSNIVGGESNILDIPFV